MFLNGLSEGLPPQPKLVDTAGLAETLGVSHDTVRDLCRQAKIPYLDIGCRTRRYDLAKVLQALQREGQA